MLFFSDCPQRLRVVRDLWRVVRDLWRVDRDLWWVVRDLCTHRQPWLERGELVRDLWSIVRDLYLVDQYLGRIDPDLWLDCPRPVEGRKSVLCGGFYLWPGGQLPVWPVTGLTWRSVWPVWPVWPGGWWWDEQHVGHDGRGAEGLPADHQLPPPLHLTHREAAPQLEEGQQILIF